MNKEVLQAMIQKWRKIAKPPECENGHPDARDANIFDSGVRTGLSQCADELQSLINLLSAD